MNNNPVSDQFADPATSEASGNGQPARARRILVVDDEPQARVLAFRVFSQAGFEVTTVQSGFECLDHFRKSPNRFDMIVLDLSMPYMDGEETFKRLRALNPTVVVLLSTGFLNQAQDRIERMQAMGLAGFIRKPHRPDELLAQVNAVLERVKFSRAGCAPAVWPIPSSASADLRIANCNSSSENGVSERRLKSAIENRKFDYAVV